MALDQTMPSDVCGQRISQIGEQFRQHQRAGSVAQQRNVSVIGDTPSASCVFGAFIEELRQRASVEPGVVHMKGQGDQNDFDHLHRRRIDDGLILPWAPFAFGCPDYLSAANLVVRCNGLISKNLAHEFENARQDSPRHFLGVADRRIVVRYDILEALNEKATKNVPSMVN